jgi:lysophospholipase L1-like esterase
MTTPSNTRRRIAGSLAASLVTLVAVVLGAAGPVNAEPPSQPVAKYVALGDSYAAGQGAGDPLDGCLRSTAAYPVLLDAEPRTNLLRQASCSGATIEEVMTTQLAQVNRGTTLVTISAGGNDLAIGEIYAYCVNPQTQLECAAAVAAAGEKLSSGVVGADLLALIVAVSERAPNAKIIVTDYPIPFADGLNPLTDTINAYTVLLNAQIAGAVAAADALGIDVELASVVVAFAGSEYPFGNPPLLGIDTSNPVAFLHPTAAGQAVYRDVILAELAD